MSDNWYYAFGDKEYGPNTEDRMRQLVISRQINSRTMVWNDELTRWHTLGETSLYEGTRFSMNGWIWLFVLTNAVIAFYGIYIFANTLQNSTTEGRPELAGNFASFLLVLLALFFLIVDLRAQKKSGYPVLFREWFAAFVFWPGWLFMRAQKHDKGFFCAFVGVAVFLIQVALIATSVWINLLYSMKYIN